ncbi:MAG: fructokinase, partial [Gaiellaceae bacterium]|nr:fructokinase [Gaiellaceae bacterium]
GGTKCVCAVGTGPEELRATETFPTTDPGETLGRAVAFFEREGPVDAIGIGSFGPLDRRPGSMTWGHLTSTPKPGWEHAPVAPEIQRRLSVPVGFDTDVNAAALGEHRWGAAQGLDTFCYITVGTGIGGGGMVGGALLHGLSHPEFGHMRIPHDRARDPFDGACPYHGDCFEGLASGMAIEARGEADWELEAEYLALGLVNVICLLSPQRIIIGGGVMKEPSLLPRVREQVTSVLAGYVEAPEIVPPALGDRAGVLGALELARLALE